MKHYLLYPGLVFVLSASSVHAQDAPPFPPPPADVSSTVVLAPRDEPGERLVIRGTVYHADGTSPYRGFVMYLYQTDTSGVYNHVTGSWREPRLYGWVKTNKLGGYTIETVKPGSYPRSRNPAHIHAIVMLPGRAPQWIDDFLFSDDPFITEKQRQESHGKGSFSNILQLSRGADKVLTGIRDIRVDNEGSNR